MNTLIDTQEVITQNIKSLTEQDLLDIHKTLHSPLDNSVVVQGIVIPIKVASNGCRYITIKDKTIMEQNKNKDSKYAQRARDGEKLSWVIQSGKWLLITDEGVQW